MLQYSKNIKNQICYVLFIKTFILKTTITIQSLPSLFTSTLKLSYNSNCIFLELPIK